MIISSCIQFTLRLTLISVALFFLSLIFTGCSETPVSNVNGQVSFTKDIYPIFAQNCSSPSCHNSFDHPSGIDLTGWQSLMLNGSYFGSEVIPYNSRWSHLVQHINRDTNVAPVALPFMPKFLPPYSNGLSLSSSNISLIMKWIDEGAKNDDGEVAFSGITRKAFITNQASDYIAVVNLDNNFVIRLVPVGQGDILAAPHNVEVDKQGNYFYTTLISTGYIEKFDARTYEKLGSLLISSKPGHVVITNDGSKGYVTNYDGAGDRIIKSFNTENMTVANTISDIRLNSTHGEKLTHDGQYLIAIAQIGEFAVIIRTSDDAIEQVIPVASNVPPNGNGTGLYLPIAVSISPDDKFAFITCFRSSDVRVLDLQSRTIIKIIPVGLNPIQSECSPDGRWCYVANRNSNSVSVIDIQPQILSVVRTIPNIGIEPHGVAFTPDGHYAYVTCESQSRSFVHHTTVGNSKPGTTAVIDVWNGSVKVKDIEMASYPAGISITR